MVPAPEICVIISVLIAVVIELEAEDAVDVPFAFVAVTVNVYEDPVVRPLTVTGDDAPVPVNAPGEEVAVNVETAAPPVAFAVNVTDALIPFPPAVAVPIVGACGIVVAVIEPDVVAVEVPLAFVAVTLKVYDVADCRPVTVTGEPPDAVNDPGLEVAVYEEIALPPVAPPVAVIVADPLLNARPVPTFAAVTTGACGTVVAVAFAAADASPVPAAFIAEILYQYCCELVSDVSEYVVEVVPVFETKVE
jgi:hypothetical protein